MHIESFTFNPFETNCYVCHDGGEAVIVDPSSASPREHRVVVDYLEREGLTVRHLLLTHAHIDHIFGCAFFAARYGQPFALHRDDLTLLRRGPEQAQLFGVSLEAPPEPDRFLAEGDTISFGETTWEVRHAPGHSPGSVCFYDARAGAVLAGDVLFQGSIGRTDLWKGSLPQLMRSIHDQLMTLDDDTAVYPGHGPATTIGRERATNPFLIGGGY